MINLFGLKKDMLGILFGYVFILVSLFQLVLTDSFADLSVFFGIALLFGLHQSYNLIILLGTGQGHAWVSKKTNGKPWKFWLTLLAFLTGLFFLFAYLAKMFPISDELYTPLYLSVILIAEGFLRTQHGVMQVFGLGRGYDYIAEHEAGVVVPFQSRHKERLLCLAFMILCVLARSSLIVAPFYPSLGQELKLGLYAFVFLSLFVLVLLLNDEFNSVHRGRSLKPHFMTRLILTGLAPVSTIAYSAERLLHGMEHHFLTEKFLKKDLASKKLLLLAVLPLAVVTMFIITFKTHGVLSHFVPSEGFRFATAAYGSLAVSHVVLDRMMFKMKDANTRETIGKFLWAS